MKWNNYATIDLATSGTQAISGQLTERQRVTHHQQRRQNHQQVIALEVAQIDRIDHQVGMKDDAPNDQAIQQDAVMADDQGSKKEIDPGAMIAGQLAGKNHLNQILTAMGQKKLHLRIAWTLAAQR